MSVYILFLTIITTEQTLKATMTTFTKKFFICIVLFCFIQSIKSIDSDPETQEKITNLLGKNVLALRSYQQGLKLETQRFDHNYRTAVSEAKNSIKTELDKIINEIKPHTELKPCGDQVVQGIEEITKQSDTIHNNCASSVKPNLADFNEGFTKHNKFQSQIGSTPKNCMDTHNDIDSFIKCIEKAMEDIGKAMKESENQLNGKVNEIKQKMSGLQTTLANCQAKGLVELKSKSKDVEDKFNQCVKS